MGEFRVVVVPRDYRATTRFLVDVMGLEVVDVFDQWDEGMVLKAGDGLIEIFTSGDQPAGGASSAWLALEVTDVDTEHERLKAAGADISRHPETQPWGHRSFRVQGPEGWRITLYEIVDAE